ncbi:hypothetical protein GA0061070_1001192 [Kosakonia oryziphila]|uniref:Uncharacterized protein n=1 Tax=Kosakonia oryziphila TaxID=1005667 RepID=A0A1C3Z776_9ENTR|nr:hypothetical protein GA0061070_1001192 [Kosakonia oryziphila]
MQATEGFNETESTLKTMKNGSAEPFCYDRVMRTSAAKARYYAHIAPA